MNVSCSLLSAVTVDYVPFALIALESAKQNSRFKHFYLFVADAKQGTLQKLRQDIGVDVDWITLFGPDDLGPELSFYFDCFAYYTPFEVSQLAKYVGIYHALQDEKVGDVCAFVDSDTYFFGDVCHLLENMGSRGVYLTPHMLKPSNDDQLEHETMLHGWINTGFSAFKSQHSGAKTALEWMMSRIHRRAFLAPHLGLSGDQTWGSALPFMFPKDVIIDSTPGLNVAYWNLIERELSGDELTNIQVNGTPLLMFHYSGFDEQQPMQLSKHASPELAAVRSGTTLDLICRHYAGLLSQSKPWRAKIKGYERMTCCKSRLESRIDVCTNFHAKDGVNLYASMPRPGFFSRAGFLADAVIRRLKQAFIK